MISIAICDDLWGVTEELRTFIRAYDWSDEISISVFLTAEKLFDVFRKGYQPDILFMDVCLEKNDEGTLGTDIALWLKTNHPNILIVYISAYNTYKDKIMQAEPFRFLKKPFTSKDINWVLDAACQRIKFYNMDYKVEYNGKIEIIRLKETSYIYSMHRKVYFHNGITGKETYCYKKLDDVEGEVDKMCSVFARANKSCLVNLKWVRKIGKNDVNIENAGEDTIDISLTRKYKDEFIRKSVDYI